MSNRGPIISIFEEHSPPQRGFSSILLSGVAHGLGAGILGFGMLQAPRIRESVLMENYSVRHLDLHSSELHNGLDSRYYPSPDARAKDSDKDDSDQSPELLLPESLDAIEARQTLVQPDFHAEITIPEEPPVPAVLIWTPEQAVTKHIVAPVSEKPAAAENQASLDAPNQELNPAEHAVASALSAPKIPAPPAGTTLPVVVQSYSLLHLAPGTTSASMDLPTPAALLSISDLRMTDGTMILPPINQIRSATDRGSLIPAVMSVSHGSGFPAGWSDGYIPGMERELLARVESRTTQRIQLQKDGKFSVVVVGSSLAEQYPQTLRIWSDRVAYTAYLHVGLNKNWILQYAQPRSTDAAHNGNVARLEAPWPYDILRPNLLASDLNADALMVHGILNEAGQLESLAIAFPQQFSQAAFVLQALEKWQFRPARQQGKPTAVEVLLIIPEELD